MRLLFLYIFIPFIYNAFPTKELILFKNEEKKLRKLFDTKLLSELLLLNYQYSNNEYLGTTAEDVYNSLSKKIKYTKKEKEQIVKNAIQLLNIEHGINVINYEELNFEKIN